jgi:hypothetical protein
MLKLFLLNYFEVSFFFHFNTFPFSVSFQKKNIFCSLKDIFFTPKSKKEQKIEKIKQVVDPIR